MKKQSARQWCIFILVSFLSILIMSCGGKSADKSDTTVKNISTATTESRVSAEPVSAAKPTAPSSGATKQTAAIETAEGKFGNKEGWNFSRYGGWADHKWDSDVLPASIPSMPDGALADQTYYKGVDNESMFTSEAGRLRFSDSRFEKWDISFYCEQEQIDTLLADIKANGFVGGSVSGYHTTYDFVGNGYYLYLEFRGNYVDNGYSYSCSMIVAKPIFQMPKTFQGAKLPQTGAIIEDFTNEESYWTYAYDENGDEVEWKYDFLKDKGSLPPYFEVWYRYVGATEEDAKAWAYSLYDDGWAKTYEHESDMSGYSAGGTQDGLYFVSKFIDYDNLMEIGFSNVEESLNY